MMAKILLVLGGLLALVMSLFKSKYPVKPDSSALEAEAKAAAQKPTGGEGEKALVVPQGAEGVAAGQSLGNEELMKSLEGLLAQSLSIPTTRTYPGSAVNQAEVAKFITDVITANRGIPDPEKRRTVIIAQIGEEFDEAFKRVMEGLDTSALNKFIDDFAKGNVQVASDKVFGAMLSAELAKDRLPGIDPAAMKELYAVISRDVTSAGESQAIEVRMGASEKQMELDGDKAVSDQVMNASIEKFLSSFNAITDQTKTTIELKDQLAMMVSDPIDASTLTDFLQKIGLEGPNGEAVASMLSIYFFLSKTDRQSRNFKALRDLIQKFNGIYKGLMQQVTASDTAKANQALSKGQGPVLGEVPKMFLGTTVADAALIQKAKDPSFFSSVFLDTQIRQVNVQTLVVYLLAAQISDAAKRTQFLEGTGIIRFENGVPVNLIEQAINKFMDDFKAAKVQAAAA